MNSPRPKQRDAPISVADSAFYDAAFLQRYDALQGASAEVKAAEQRVLDGIVYLRRQSRLPCERYLDVGTCTGRYLIWARDNGFRTLCGLDHSPDAIAHCRTKLTFPARLIEGSCLDMESYRGVDNLDFVTMMMGTANHLTGPELKTFLLGVSTVIATSGELVLSTWRCSPERLMLYSEADARKLCGIALNLAELQTTGAQLTIVNRIATSWHDLWVFRKA
jgi:SAM-dependent methyltransferase